VGLLFVWTQPVYAQESPAFEKIRDTSPDAKFALRISCSSEPENPDDIDSNLITAVDLVSLPSKTIVKNVGQNSSGSAPELIWSKDSKWLAYPVSSGTRVTETYVYHRVGDEFMEVKTDDLRVEAKGDVRNEYVKPLRWIKPGVLLLEQFDIFRGGNGEDATYQFTAKFDGKTGKFQISSKKKVPSKE
jgi:hypothetical protein